ncbi:AI-2E family transporter [Halomarina oriensis]|uniref:AI-2E family transporter n=1 Tax=Halomarina oriensis TaxID=671145 RepID=UPI0018EF12DC|nr:AI-2E family transporter [Halomarina oriensis]
MHLARRRRNVLAVLLVLFSLAAAYVLWEVVGTVFFAITVAYVLVPVRNRLVGRGLSRRVASALVTVGAFLVVVFVVAALGYLLYQRWDSALALVESLPDTLSLDLAGMTYALELSEAIAVVTAALQGLATSVAPALPVVALKLVLFAILLFGLLLRPGATGRSVQRVVPEAYHDILVALNERIRDTLYGIYVLQAATAFGTGVVALVVFYALGYESLFTLAIIAGLLQFVPVLGPTVLVVVLALVDLAAGDGTRAVLVLVGGGVLIGAVPDAVIRPRLASWAADLPTSLYFIGFVGGILTVGAIGFIMGPLVVALVIEVVELIASEQSTPEEASEDDDLDATPEGEGVVGTDDAGAAGSEAPGDSTVADDSSADGGASTGGPSTDRDGPASQ